MNIKEFKFLNKTSSDIAGGKGASLGEMINSGVPVPDGYVILSNAFKKYIEYNNLKIEIDAILETVKTENINSVEKASEKIQSLILEKDFPKEIEEEIFDNYIKLNCQFVAVRSSATAEDGAEHAWAGQLNSYLNTSETNLLENVKNCFASLFTPRAIFYRFEKKLNRNDISVAVVIQKMIQSEVSGIAFSVHPVTEDRNQIIIEAGYGLGEAIVSGQITPDSYVVHKNNLEIIDKKISKQDRGLFKEGKDNSWQGISKDKKESQKLTDSQINELSQLIIKIENHYGFPCDIEWAYENNEFYITQSRPITTLSNNNPTVTKNTDSSFRKIVEFPFLPVTTWESANCALINNPYLQKMGITKYPAAITFQKDNFEYWANEATLPILTDANLINEISTNTLEVMDKELILIKKYISATDQTSDVHLQAFKNLNRALREICYGYAFFTDEWIVTEDENLLQTLPEIRIKLSNNLSFFWEAYLKVMHFIEKSQSISMKELDHCVAQEIEILLNGGEIDRKKLETRSFALSIKDNKVEYLFGNDADDLKSVLNLQDPNNYYITKATNEKTISGNIAHKGVAMGKVVVLHAEDYRNYESILKDKKDYVLVTPMTRPEIVPFLKQALAIITDEGGITCHAAIVAREMNKPCLIGTKIASQVLKDGDLVEVDANNGTIKIIERKNKLLTKIAAREKGLFYADLWNLGDRKYIQLLFGEDWIGTIFIEKNNGFEMWNNFEDFDLMQGKILKQINKDRKIESSIENMVDKSWDYLKKFSAGSVKINNENFAKYIKNLQDFWGGFNAVIFESLDSELLSKEFKSFMEKIRVESEKYSDFLNDLPIIFLREKFSEIIPFLDYLNLEEILDFLVNKKIDKKKLEERKSKGWFIYREKYYLKDYLKLFLEENNFTLKSEEGMDELVGKTAYPGLYTGKVQIVTSPNQIFENGNILVVTMTKPENIQQIKKAGAIVTDEGGVLSHASIISREFKIPCVVGTFYATSVLKDGDIVEVDANRGIVKIIKRNL